MATSKDLRKNARDLNKIALSYEKNEISYNEFMKEWFGVRQVAPLIINGKEDPKGPVAIAAVAHLVTTETKRGKMTKEQGQKILADLETQLHRTDL